jgi:hypothetical protein
MQTRGGRCHIEGDANADHHGPISLATSGAASARAGATTSGVIAASRRESILPLSVYDIAAARRTVRRGNRARQRVGEGRPLGSDHEGERRSSFVRAGTVQSGETSTGRVRDRAADSCAALSAELAAKARA